MKKHYCIFGTIFCSLILFIFAGIMYMYLKNQISRINSDYFMNFQSDYWLYELNAEGSNEEPEIDIESAACGIYDRYMPMSEDYGQFNIFRLFS